jgi:hypothetical protein
MESISTVEIGDTVRVNRTDGTESYEGQVKDVKEYDTDSEDAIYIRFVHEKNPTGDDGFVEYKEGTWNGREYSWLRKASPNTTNSIPIDEDCWELTVL